MVILHTKFRLIWTTVWPMKKIYFWISLIAKFAKFRMKISFFSQASYNKILFVLHSDYNGDIPYRLWLDLNNFLSQWERPFYQNTYSNLFEKKNRKFAYENLTFFLGKQ